MFSMDCTCSFLTRFISRSAASILQDEYRCSRGFVSCFLMYSYYHSMLFLSSIFLIFLYFLMGILFIMHIFDILYKHYKLHFCLCKYKISTILYKNCRNYINTFILIYSTVRLTPGFRETRGATHQLRSQYSKPKPPL